ncbi:RbsD or FucU transport [Tessaracoccus sp. MC1865]|uniref:RbsD/FucU family protein n=1 Tax=unclassified Tessaracoccus TaxID=2635419 RepID=UPI0016048843|nr:MULTISPECIES: RbsD/FucU family protein [unclassified Tessaracoccus]MBB1482658.1 RbsD or FucU transport [Tessaracoccus sp. MC1865]MBB1509850.1 RbsD or FucU transport [Tessaracoccus sp. MC1756]QTO37891.1 RbsD/FucU family protein [Tessaracoccus sp. MC1865]
MLNGPMIHPELLNALGRAGHGSKILITDGNYPHETGANPRARRIYLNLAPGLLNVSQILDVLKQAVPIEQAGIMVPAADAPPELRPEKIDAHDEYKAALPGVEFVEIPRWDFYDEAKKDDVGIVIASGEQRIYANLLLTIGVRQ